jgi:hypothetical protein
LHVPTTSDVAVKQWKSTKSTGVGHAALVLADTDKKTPGTVSAVDCDMSNGTATASWVYSAYDLQDGWQFPADDGTGKPLAKNVKAGQPAWVIMHLTNASGVAIKEKVKIEGVGHAAGTVVTPAEPFVTYNTTINVAAGAMNDTESKTCPTPTGAKILYLSTLSRKLSTATKISSGGGPLFLSSDWQDPGRVLAVQPPYLTFASDQVSVECTYTNGTGSTVNAGPATSDEVCMMLGYHFPATKPRLCVDTILLP